MRFINPDVVEDNLPDGWLKEAQEAYDSISELTGQERAIAINSLSGVWSNVKDTLRDASHKKCWYCESIDSRSDNAVDHFRPKNSIAEAGNLQSGYWWLAFDWRNYRFSCTFCNSYRKSDGITGGKQHHFPLMNEDSRARPPDYDIEAEEPKLLDPTVAGDYWLLSFDPGSGDAVPRSTVKEDDEYDRADESILRYHLNQKIIKKRRKKSMDIAKKKIRSADKHYRNREGDKSAKVAYSELLQELIVMTKSHAEYSAAIRLAAASLRGESVIPDQIFAA